MKKKWNILSFVIAVILIAVVAGLGACLPEPATPTDGPSVAPAQPPGAVTLVKSKWSGGDLYFTKTDGTTILKLDGTNGDAEITTATITTATATTLTPTANNTSNLGSAILGWADLYLFGGQIWVSASANLTLPSSTDVLVGRATTDTLTNKTLTSPTINAGTLTGTVTGNATFSQNPTFSGTPVFSGTPTFANHATGTATITANTTSAVVVHGMSGTPTVVLLTWAEDPGTDPELWWGSAGSSNFTITASTAVNESANITISWLAFIADE